jgi:acyl carrier protein
MELQNRLNQVFREVFDNDDINIALDTTADDIDGWDSLSHVNLIVAIETKFNIRFSNKELMTFKNVGDLLDCIRKKITN